MNATRNTTTRDWTVLIYQGNGCRGKFQTHQNDLYELDQLPNCDQVAVVSQGHKHLEDDVLVRFEHPTGVQPAHVDTTFGRQSSPHTLANFIRWA